MQINKQSKLKMFLQSFSNVSFIIQPHSSIKNPEIIQKLKFLNFILLIFAGLLSLRFVSSFFSVTGGSAIIKPLDLAILFIFALFYVCLYFLGKSQHYKTSLYLVILFPLVVFWSTYSAYVNDYATGIADQYLINASYSIAITIVIAGLLYSLRGITIVTIIAIIDMYSFYRIFLHYPLSWVIPKVFLVMFLFGFTLIELKFRTATVNRLIIQTKVIQDDQRKIQDILDNTTVGIHVKDLQGRYILTNNRFEEISNLTRENLLGKTVDDVYPPEMAMNIKENDRFVLNSKKPKEFEEKDKRFSPAKTFLSFKFPLYDSEKKMYGIGEIDTDITEKINIDQIIKEKELAEQKVIQLGLVRELKQEEGKFRSLVQSAPNIIITTELNGKITFTNKEFDQISNIFDIFSTDDQHEINNNIKVITETNKSVSFENKEKVVFENSWYYFNIGPLVTDNHLSGFIFIATDISKQKESQNKIISQSEHIKQINNELKEFSYIVSHDLRAPLKAIESTFELLKEEVIANKIVNMDNLEIISKRIKIMNQLIEGILQYSNVEITSQKQETIGLVELVQEVIQTINPSKKYKFSVSDNLPFVIFNKYRLYQLFQNLISNAIKYIDKEEGIISITGSQKNQSEYELRISDNGIGIEEENFERIFNLFETVDTKSDNSYGIGLAIVKKIITQMEGTVRVESTKGLGSSFIFTI